MLTNAQFLTGWVDSDVATENVQALLFGVLADLAVPLVEHHRSDLFHDAGFIRKSVTGPCALLYGADAWGTFLSPDEKGMVALAHQARRNVWRVELIFHDHAWYTRTTPVFTETAD